MITISFNGRVPIPYCVFIANKTDHNVEDVLFKLPVIDENQIATLNVLLPDGTGDAIPLNNNTLNVLRDLTGVSGDVQSWVTLSVGTEKVWNSNIILLRVGNLPNISEVIERQYPTALQNAIAETNEAKEGAEQAQAAAEAAVLHSPVIRDNVWYVWDADTGDYVSTGIVAVGEDGYSPTVNVQEIPGGHRVIITDAEGDHVFDVMDGTGGGGTGDYSDLTNKPSIESVTLSGNKTASDLGLAKASDLSSKQAKITASGILKGDGNGGVSAATAGTDYGTYSKPSGGIPASDLASGVIPSVPSASSATPQPLGTAAAGSSGDYSRADHVHAKPTAADVGAVSDVQVNGTSVVTSGVANVPIADGSTLGVVKKDGTGFSIEISSSGAISVVGADSATIKGANANNKRPIVPARQHEAVFYGLAKAAGDSTQSASANAVGTYTDSAKDKIQSMLGTDVIIAPHETDPFTSAHAINDLFTLNGKLYRAKTAITAGDALNVGTNAEEVSVFTAKADKTDTVLNTYLAHGVSESSEGTGDGSIAFGEDVDAPGIAAVAFGYQTVASGNGSAAFGLGTMANGQGGFASGTQTIAGGESAFAEGQRSIAWGMGSHAGGLETIADADGMCSIGALNAMPNSYPMWTRNTAYNVGDVVNLNGLGYKCIEANNDNYFLKSKWQLIGPGEYSTYPQWVPGTSYAVGDRVVYHQEYDGFVFNAGLECMVANSDEQPSFNKWKILPSTGPIAFVVGNGDSYAPGGSNAFRVDWDGNGYLNGDLRIGCEPDSSGGKSLASLFEMIAPIEGSTASQAYPAMSAFITNGEFCMAVSDIAAGDTFAVYREGGENNPDTPNCVKMTLAQYIYGLAQQQLSL